jgi:hypothetical protein
MEKRQVSKLVQLPIATGGENWRQCVQFLKKKKKEFAKATLRY